MHHEHHVRYPVTHPVVIPILLKIFRKIVQSAAFCGRIGSMLNARSAEFGLVVLPEGSRERKLPVAVYVTGLRKRALALDGRRLVRVSQDDDGTYHDWQIGDGDHDEDQQDADTIAMLQLLSRIEERR